MARPGQYAVGSPQSRAAAGAILERRFGARDRLQIIFPLSLRHPGCKEPFSGEWTEGIDGTLYRNCSLPDGITLEEAGRVVSQPGRTPSVPPLKQERERPPLNPEW
jgi:hypothetical protein